MYLTEAESYYLIAWEYYGFDAAVVSENLRRALELDPEYAPALRLMARLQLECLNNPRRAEQCYQEAIRVAPDEPSSYLEYATFCVGIADYEKASRLLEYAEGLHGVNRVSLLLRRADVLEAQTSYEEALSVLREAYSLCLNNDCASQIEAEEERIRVKLQRGKAIRYSR